MKPTGTVRPLACPQCGERIAASDVNLDLFVALCRTCDATVELGRDDTGSTPPRAELPAPPDRQTALTRGRPPEALARLASPPAGITVQQHGQTLVLTRRWFRFSPGFLFLALWCLVWDGFLVVWYAIGFASLFSGSGEALIMLLFPILHLAVGIGVTYTLVATVVNRSRVEIDGSHVRVTHGPLPWGGPAPIPVHAVDQFYLVRQTGKNGSTSGFDLVARRVDRTSEKVLGGLESDVQGRYLEQRLEAHLGLEDVAVEGEYNG